MTRDDALAGLNAVREAIGEQFPDSPRRAQFEQHLATTTMCVEHLFDEADRSTDQ